MEKKIINFHVFRYHLLPLDKNMKQVDLFEKSLSFEDIKKRKNEFFGSILNKLIKSEDNKHPIKLEHNYDEKYIFKIAQKKTTKITQNFEDRLIENEPYCYLVFDNDPAVQKIAISDNSEAFGNPIVVKNVLLKIFRAELQKFGLNIEIKQLFNKTTFWEFVSSHKREITYINFQFIKPNLANISKSLPDVFKEFAEETNSHDSHITLKAPEKGTLTNIDKNNEEIAGLVDYASKGAGNIKLKVKGIRKQLKTKDNPKIVEILEIEQIELEGNPDLILNLYKTLL